MWKNACLGAHRKGQCFLAPIPGNIRISDRRFTMAGFSVLLHFIPISKILIGTCLWIIHIFYNACLRPYTFPNKKKDWMIFQMCREKFAMFEVSYQTSTAVLHGVWINISCALDYCIHPDPSDLLRQCHYSRYCAHFRTMDDTTFPFTKVGQSRWRLPIYNNCTPGFMPIILLQVEKLRGLLPFGPPAEGRNALVLLPRPGYSMVLSEIS